MPSLPQTLALLRVLDWDQRQVYLRLLGSRMVGRRKDALPTAHDIKKVVFVCHGNVMRSPMADACFRKIAASSRSMLSVVDSSSAGLFALAGRPGDKRAIDVAAALGYSLENHTPRPLTQALADSADLICVMDAENEAICVSRFPDAEDKVILLGSRARAKEESLDIPDPYRGDSRVVRVCYERIMRAVQGLCAELESRE